MPDDPASSVQLSDPRALRALAHPTRLQLVALLRREGPLTASQAGARLGQSPASCSFHLRQLARWGLVEEAGGGRGRARPWRATARATSWRIDGPEAAEPAAALSTLVVRYQMERLLRALAALPQEPDAWQGAAQHADTVLELTPEELDALGRQVLELFEAYRSDAAGQRREGAEARRVALFFAGLPLPEEEP